MPPTVYPVCPPPATQTAPASLPAPADAGQGAGTLQSLEGVTSTLDKGGEYSLRHLWLPSERDERDSLAYLDKLSLKAAGKPHHLSLVIARQAVFSQWDMTVRAIRDRGGLLFLGAAA